MIQIGFFVISASLIVCGIYALVGNELPEKKTAPSVAIAMIIIGVGLLIFAFVGLPMLL
jgi:hypothetical protein